MRDAAARLADQPHVDAGELTKAVAGIGVGRAFELEPAGAVDVAVRESEHAIGVVKVVRALGAVLGQGRPNALGAPAKGLRRVQRNVEPADRAQRQTVECNFDARFQRLGHIEKPLANPAASAMRGLA